MASVCYISNREGRISEASNAMGVNGNQSNNSAPEAGAAYVFVRNGTNWSQQAYLKASNTQAGDNFGNAVAIAGNTIVVGGWGEDSNATGVNGNQSDNSVHEAGAAYVFVRNGTNWTQQAYLKASNPGAGDSFGAYGVAISGDTAVVGAVYEASNATGVNGDQSNNGAQDAGAAYVFVRNGTNWSQQAYLKASNTQTYDFFGITVAITGNAIVVGASREDSNARDAGAAYVFTGAGPIPPELRLTVARNGTNLHLTATGTTNTQWRLESRDTATGTNPSTGSGQAAWQPLTNITLGPSSTVIQQPLNATNRFYRGAWLP